MGKLVVVTGGSGFIGSNLQERLVELGYRVINIDIKKPRNNDLLKYFRFLDLNNQNALCRFLTDLNPNYVVHLGARTDLLGISIEDYEVNTRGVENLCVAVSEVPSIERVLFASSMLVCRAGHIPVTSDDFSADTVYGQSKIKGEQIVMRYQATLPSNLIFRPTSIWGPQFNAPYRDFFDLVLRRRYVKIGPKASRKTYGYVENAVNQIISLMVSKEELHNNTIPYIGDNPAINADDWSEIISSIADIPIPITVPYSLIALGGLFGDCLSYIHISFPLTSFRIKNMTTNNDLSDLTACRKNQFNEVSLEEGVRRTIGWLRENRK